MVCFQTKNLGKLWRALQWKILVYFMAIWSILRQFGLFYGNLVYFVAIWYILRLFGYVVNLATLVAGLELDFMRTMPSKQKSQ
jgi:hypothetical protein